MKGFLTMLAVISLASLAWIAFEVAGDWKRRS